MFINRSKKSCESVNCCASLPHIPIFAPPQEPPFRALHIFLLYILGTMPSHSFARLLRHGLFLLSLFLGLSSCSFAPSCLGDFPSVIRAEMSDNLWASNSTLAQQRGVF